jgi:hypothetical protein
MIWSQINTVKLTNPIYCTKVWCSVRRVSVDQWTAQPLSGIWTGKWIEQDFARGVFPESHTHISETSTVGVVTRISSPSWVVMVCCWELQTGKVAFFPNLYFLHKVDVKASIYPDPAPGSIQDQSVRYLNWMLCTIWWVPEQTNLFLVAHRRSSCGEKLHAICVLFFRPLSTSVTDW